MFGFSFKFNVKALFICLLIFAISSQSAFANLDTTFGNGGKVTYRFNDREDSFQTVAVQPDGKIVVAGKNGIGRLMVLRYLSNGALDTGFASGGILTFQTLSQPLFQSMALQSDGKIVIVGLGFVASGNSAFLIVRVNPNGALDTTFDNDGIAVTDITSMADVAYDVDIQTDGKIVVTGAAGGLSANFGTIGVVRYNTDGSLDTSFDGDGIVQTTVNGNICRGYAVKLQSDGKIVVSANADEPVNFLIQTNLVIVRYLPNGALDPTFGTNGASLTDLGGFFYKFGDLEIQPDGKIVVLGSIGSDSTFIYDFSVFRFLPNGNLDTAFGTNGRTIIDAGDSNSAQALELQADGKIIAAGHAWVNGNSLDILTARLNQNGSMDSTYGTNGRVYTQVGVPPASDYAWDAVLQPDGKLIVAGDFNISFPFDYDAVLLRFLTNSSVQRRSPFDYDGDGKADISVFRPSDSVWYLHQSTNGFAATQFGISTDKIAPADFDGDGKTDIAVFREGIWYWLNSSTGSVGIVQFGLTGDIPLPADFTGDGRAELTVYRNGVWWMLDLAANQASIVQFGISTDKPVPADFDGDGKTDQAIYRNGEWHLNRSTQGYRVVNFGLSTDKPVIGDYDGDGKIDQAVYRDGTWYLLQSTNGFTAFQFGLPNDLPTPADYDGDGKTDAAVYRNGVWYLSQSTNGIFVQQFGLTNDKPTPNAFVP